MLLKTKGIVVRNVKYGETSIIADLYTQEAGMVSVIAGGIRKTKSSTPPGILQIMNWVEVVLYFKVQNNLNRVKEIRPCYLYKEIPFDIKKKGVALFMTEMIQKSIREKEKDEVLYEFIREIFSLLDATSNPVSNLVPHFMLKLAEHLGFQILGSWTRETPHFHLLEGKFKRFVDPVYSLTEVRSQWISKLCETDLTDCHLLRIPKMERKELIKDLTSFYKLHLEKFPDLRTPKIYSEIIGL